MMNYSLNIQGLQDVTKLARILDECSRERQVPMGTIKATLILVQVLDKAQKEGLIVATPEKPEG